MNDGLRADVYTPTFVMTTTVRLVIFLVASLGLLWAEQPLTEKDPEVQKYLKERDEAIGKFEAEHAAEVKARIDRLKKIHAVIYHYLLEHQGIWPQLPQEVRVNSAATRNWWKELLIHHGLASEEWDADPPVGITGFDSEPLTAYRWRGQPWVMAFGAESWPTYMILPDGSIAKDAPAFAKPPPGPFVINRGNTPATVPEELKKAAGVK